jgi:hypothetical protein
MSACNCCDAFPTDVIVRNTIGQTKPDFPLFLEWRKLEASLEKCGAREFVLNRFDGNTGADCGDIIAGKSGDYTSFKWLLSETISLSARSIETSERVSGSQTRTWTYNAETGVCDLDVNCTGFLNEDSENFEVYEMGSRSVSNEYTSETLISNVAAKIPSEFSGAWQQSPPLSGPWEYGEYFVNEAASCIRQLIEKAGYYDESKIQIRLNHAPTATGYLKVWLGKRTTAYSGEDLDDVVSPPIDQTFQIYEWEGEPLDKTKGINEPENRVLSAIFEVERPQPQTQVTIVVWKWSFLRGYEPSDPTRADVEPGDDARLVRLPPDCESNAIPTLSQQCPFRE